MLSSEVLRATGVGYAHTSPNCDRWACRGLDLKIHAGEIVALLGPNGAGKSTFISLAMGLRIPLEGQIEILNQSPTATDARRKLGVVPQESIFPKTVKVREILNFVAAQYETSMDPEVLKALDLEKLMPRQLGRLSGGERRRVGLACAMGPKPPLLILDEPTTGLDLESRRGFFSSLQMLVRKNQCCALFSTHHFAEVEALATRVVVLNEGRKLREGSLEEIRREVGFKRVSFFSNALDLHSQIPAPWKGTVSEGRHDLLLTDPENFLKWLVQTGLPFDRLEVHAASLEDAFLHLVKT